MTTAPLSPYRRLASVGLLELSERAHFSARIEELKLEVTRDKARAESETEAEFLREHSARLVKQGEGLLCNLRDLLDMDLKAKGSAPGPGVPLLSSCAPTALNGARQLVRAVPEEHAPDDSAWAGDFSLWGSVEPEAQAPGEPRTREACAELCDAFELALRHSSERLYALGYDGGQARMQSKTARDLAAAIRRGAVAVLDPWVRRTLLSYVALRAVEDALALAEQGVGRAGCLREALLMLKGAIRGQAHEEEGRAKAPGAT